MRPIDVERVDAVLPFGGVPVGADFLICEIVNPAFDETVNVVVELPFEPGELRVAGEVPGSVDLELGEIEDRVTVEGIDVARDGRTLSGSADAEGTEVESSFTC